MKNGALRNWSAAPFLGLLRIGFIEIFVRLGLNWVRISEMQKK